MQERWNKSHIIVNSDIEATLSEVSNALRDFRVVIHKSDDFLIENAKAVVKEAYIAEENVKYIVLAALSFNTVSQNSLLKVLEEPPKNIKFIIIVPTRSILLPTIRSRLPLILNQEKQTHQSVDLNFKNLTLAELFDFAKENERKSKHDAKTLIEAIFIEASLSVTMREEHLKSFDDAYRLVDLNSRFQSVIVMLLLPFIQTKKKFEN